MEGLVTGIPACDATLNDGLDEAFAPAGDCEFTFIEIGTLGVAGSLSSAPWLAKASLEEVVPSYGILVLDGRLDGVI